MVVGLVIDELLEMLFVYYLKYRLWSAIGAYHVVLHSRHGMKIDHSGDTGQEKKASENRENAILS